MQAGVSSTGMMPRIQGPERGKVIQVRVCPANKARPIGRWRTSDKDLKRVVRKTRATV